MRHWAKRHTRALAAVLIIALLSAMPAFAEPLPGSEETSPPVTPVAPVSEDTSATPISEDTSATPSQEASESTVPVETDEETERFREELAAQQALIDEFRAQLDELDRQLAIAVETYNASVEELSYTKERLATTEADLEQARKIYEVQTDRLNERVRALYLEGEMSGLDLLLDSKSLPDFFSRLVFLTTMGEYDSEIAEQLASERTRIEDDVLFLDNARLKAVALEFELKAQQIEVMLRIEERQQMLAGANVELLTLLADEAARRGLEQQELLEAVLTGAGEVGIKVLGGTPVETAFAYHGIPYLWAGELPSGFDCSGLVLYVFKQHGVDLPHSSGSQFLLGTRVAPADLKPGDVVFFGNPIHHVGIYVGAGFFIHAPRTGDFVKVSPLAERIDFAGARRYDWALRLSPPLGVEPEVIETE
jgi:peptidoglycan hydrolase CwlO-like protein